MHAMRRVLRAAPATAALLLAAAACSAVRHGAAPAPVASAAACPWVHSTAPIAERVAQVVSAMTLNEKVAMVHGAGGSAYVGYIPAIPRLCIPALKLEDGPAGVADGMKGVTQLPAPVAVAASWDTALARTYGSVVGAEEWGKGANVDLGPTVNIVRDPRWGRAFESYGEDPYLTGRIAVAYIRGVQGQGVLAQVKHWVAYNQETFRNEPADDVVIDRRALHEIYMPQFEAAVRDGGASSVMCAYSTIEGSYACQNAYTQDSVLEGRWGFDGFVTSDWGATHSTVRSAMAGLDVEMPGSKYFGAALEAAVRDGEVPVARLDDMVSRVLREEFRFGLFDRTQTGDSATVVTNERHAAVAREVAERGTVLLRNQGSVLPLDARRLRSIAVIGPSAGAHALSGGGGSAAVIPPYVVTPFEGIAKRAGPGVRVRYAEGVPAPNQAPPAVPAGRLVPPSGAGHGLQAEFYADTTLSGPPVAARVDPVVGFNWHGRPPAPGVPGDRWSARWTGSLVAPAGGTYTFALTSDDGSRLFVDGVRVIDNWRDQGPTTKTAKVTLGAGQTVRIVVEYYQDRGGDSLALGWVPPEHPSTLERAVALADSSDVAVVFVRDFEAEGSDLADIDLPGEQDELVRAVAAANPHTIVVLNTGSAVTMPWIDSVAAVLEAWYPGQEDGNAIARVLFGDVDPAGKLPVTFPKSLADVPAASRARWPGEGGRVRYGEGLDVGYRWYQARHIEPLFPFGFGLSYTTFRLSGLRVAQAGGGSVRVGVDVTNTGARAGADVVQVYVADPAASGEPPEQLAGFRRVRLRPGETRHLEVVLGARAFAHWDAASGGRVVDAGTYGIGVGDSSADLPLRATVALQGGALR